MSFGSQVTAVQYGVGPIGARVARVARDRGIQFVGAVDIDPDKIGADLGELIGLDRALGVTVTDEPDSALSTEPDVVFHTTLSSLEKVQPQLERIMNTGVNVISTTEELSYPWRTQPERAEHLDEVARENQVRCLGTGINPGFAMDVLPAVLTTPCQEVEAVRVQRIQDASRRRLPLQKKVGAGLTIEAFENTIATRGGHVGLRESLHMLAEALGWESDGVEETMEPVIAREPVNSDHFTVEPGQVLGIHQQARFRGEDRAKLELDLKMFLGGEPVDRVSVRGEPDLEVEVRGGFHGDVATPAVLINCLPGVLKADPGLLTMLDITVPSYHA